MKYIFLFYLVPFTYNEEMAMEKGYIFSSLLVPLAHERSDIHLQLYM